MEKVEVPKWAEEIIGWSLAEFDGTNREELVERVKTTAVGAYPKLLAEFDRLLDEKAKILVKFPRQAERIKEQNEARKGAH